MTDKIHNPDEVSADKIGERWRLVTEDEMNALPWDAEVWSHGSEGWHWKPSTRRGRFGLRTFSYRTQIQILKAMTKALPMEVQP